MLRNKILGLIIRQILSRLSPDILKSVVDDALDAVENAVADSSHSFDDQSVLPLIKMVRTAFDIPDDIGGDED